MGCPLLALHLVKTWKFTPESIIKNPHHILKSRRRTTVFDIPMLNNDSRISSGFVNFDNWSWNSNSNDNNELVSSPISPTSNDNIYSSSPPTSSPINEDIWGKKEVGKGVNHENEDMESTTLLDDVDFNDYKVALIKRLLSVNNFT